VITLVTKNHIPEVIDIIQLERALKKEVKVQESKRKIDTVCLSKRIPKDRPIGLQRRRENMVMKIIICTERRKSENHPTVATTEMILVERAPVPPDIKFPSESDHLKKIKTKAREISNPTKMFKTSENDHLKNIETKAHQIILNLPKRSRKSLRFYREKLKSFFVLNTITL